jgi:N-methylhydantoinase B
VKPGELAPGIDPARVEVFKHLFASVAEEMGGVLRRTAYSPNIKERRDYSCALFDERAALIAQAAHIPVHLGAMPLSVASCVESLHLRRGDVAILNDPYRGGTHLPDITLVTPIFGDDGAQLLGFSASRAHHADVGGSAPGSMTLARELYQEGIVIPPVKLVNEGKLDSGIWDLILANVRTPEERAGDLRAQIAANAKGSERMLELERRYGPVEVRTQMRNLLAYSELMMRNLIRELPDGEYRFEDRMDDDGVTDEPAVIRVSITIDGDQVTVDFTGTCEQRQGAINAVHAITLSAVYYVFRCLVGLDIPSNGGCLAPIRLITPAGTLVNARSPAAVAGGNVETSQRIVDVLLGALARACPERVPAASQGTMNNVTIGGHDPERARPYAYYETIAGGMGGRPGRDGVSAIHTHMTNTLNTPVEALEFAYPLRVRRYEIRRGSGGEGLARGGDGIRRDLEALAPATVSILSERRRFPPYGLEGGAAGEAGRNLLIRGGEERELPGKTSRDLVPGDIVSIRTPGGGAHGAKR